MPFAPVLAINHSLRRVNIALPIAVCDVTLTLGVGRRGKTVNPTDVVPVADVKRLDNQPFAFER